MGKFVITKRVNGEFQFSLKAGNGETILNSEGYTTKSNCQNGIDSVKRNAQDENQYDHKIAANGKFYFTLEAVNGQTIGISELYETVCPVFAELATDLQRSLTAFQTEYPAVKIEKIVLCGGGFQMHGLYRFFQHGE